ncbi:unnamed protein product, partial [Notodromas monacha]
MESITYTQGVCCLPEGTIAVSDSNNQCVQVFTEKGECVLRFGTRGRGVGQLQRPTGISTLPNGNFVIADYENRCLSVFDASGKFLSRVGVNKLLGDRPASKLARTSAANRLSVSSSVPGGLCGSHSANAGSSVRSRRTSRSSLGSAMSMSGNPRKLVAVVPDDLLGRIGRKGRAVGEFANPQ